MPRQDQPDSLCTIPGALAEADRPRLSLGEFAQRVAVAALVTVLILALAYLAWRGAHVLLQAFAGVLFAVFLSALSDWLSQRTGMARGWALGLVIVGILVVVGGVGWLLANRLAVQVRELSQQLPQSLEQVRAYLLESAWGRVLHDKTQDAADVFSQAVQFLRLTWLVSGLTDFLVTAVVILFVGIFGAAEPGLYKAGLLHVVPPPYRRRVAEALDAVAYNLRGWLMGQLWLMLMIGVTTAVALWLLGIPMALTLGLIAGVLELIPYVGAWIAAVPATLVALLVSPWHLLLVLALYLGLHVLEGYMLAPLIQRRAVHLPPALTLVAQVLLGDLAGVLGLFVAAPLTVTVVVFVKMLYVEDALGDATVEVPGVPGEVTPPVSGHLATADKSSVLADK
jgi:predicted PurR-regulated permease PerM